MRGLIAALGAALVVVLCVFGALDAGGGLFGGAAADCGQYGDEYQFEYEYEYGGCVTHRAPAHLFGHVTAGSSPVVDTQITACGEVCVSDRTDSSGAYAMDLPRGGTYTLLGTTPRGRMFVLGRINLRDGATLQHDVVLAAARI